MTDVIEVVVDDYPIVVVVDDLPIEVTITEAPIVVDIYGGVGPQAPPGPPGASGSAPFIYDQDSPSSNWPINHNLGYYPQVSLLSDDGAVFMGRVVHVDVDNVVIVLNTPMTGKAALS